MAETDTILMENPDVPFSKAAVIRSAFDSVWADKGWTSITDDPAEIDRLLDEQEAAKAKAATAPTAAAEPTRRTGTTPSPAPAPEPTA